MASESTVVDAAKRGPTTDSVAEEEQSSSPMKKQKVEEEEKIYSDTYLPELGGRKPQWDDDSYDDREYESDPEDSKLFSDEEEYEEYRLERRRAFDSKGFIYEPLSGNYPIKDLDEEVYPNVTSRDMMTDLANLCVKKLNDTEKKTVELVEIVRVIVLGGSTRKAYITFMARESPNGPLIEYQAKVVTYYKNLKPPVPILCRPSPIPTI